MSAAIAVASDHSADVLLVLILIVCPIFFYFSAPSYTQEYGREVSASEATDPAANVLLVLILIFLHFLLVGDFGFWICPLLQIGAGERSLCRGH